MARVTLAALGATLVAVAGFAPGQPVAPMRPNAHARCSSSPACSETSRRALLGGVVGATASVAALWVGPQQALAGYVMNLGIEQTMPKDAERDDEAFQSSKAQTSLKNLLTYKVMLLPALCHGSPERPPPTARAPLTLPIPRARRLVRSS